MNQTIQFFVTGTPKPAGSKRPFNIFRRGPNGERMWTGKTVVIDANKNAKDWKADVSAAAKAVYSGPLLTCALRMVVLFILRRPEGHYGTGKNADKLKPSAPEYPTTKIPGDLLKLTRGVEDALTGIIYADDAQIVSHVLDKQFQADRSDRFGALVTIAPLKNRTDGSDAVRAGVAMLSQQPVLFT